MPMFSEVKVTRPRPRRKNPKLHAFNIPPMHRIQKTTAPRPRRDRKSGYRLRTTTRVVASVIKAGNSWSDTRGGNIPRNSDAPIRDPDARTIHRAYTPLMLKVQKRVYPVWDHTLTSSEEYRSGASQMVHPFTIRRNRYGKHGKPSK